MEISAKRKNTITTEQLDAIFKHCFRPFLKGGINEGSHSHNLVNSRMTEANILYNPKTQLFTVVFGKITGENAKLHFAFTCSFFRKQCIGMIIHQANTRSCTNDDLRKMFISGMRIEKDKYLNKG